MLDDIKKLFNEFVGSINAVKIDHHVIQVLLTSEHLWHLSIQSFLHVCVPHLTGKKKGCPMAKGHQGREGGRAGRGQKPIDFKFLTDPNGFRNWVGKILGWWNSIQLHWSQGWPHWLKPDENLALYLVLHELTCPLPKGFFTGKTVSYLVLHKKESMSYTADTKQSTPQVRYIWILPEWPWQAFPDKRWQQQTGLHFRLCMWIPGFATEIK